MSVDVSSRPILLKKSVSNSDGKRDANTNAGYQSAGDDVCCHLGRYPLTPCMIALKRYIRTGHVVSVVCHLGVLIVGLLFVGANAFHAPPPDAMVVEVVTPDELPRFEGTPSGLRSSGSQTPSPADGKGAVTQAPPPTRRPQPQQETQQRPNPQREATKPAAPRQPAPEPT